MDATKLHALMEDNPRLTSRQYAEMADVNGLADDIDAHELKIREIQKNVRRIARESKSDPEFAFVSINETRDDGTVDQVYMPAKACTSIEAQRVLDDYATDIEGLFNRGKKLRDYWNAAPFNFQLRFNWG